MSFCWRKPTQCDAPEHSGKIKLLPAEREKVQTDVLIVGAGPAGLACALRMAQLFDQHNRKSGNPVLLTENIYVLEKACEIGAHQLSGAVMDPRGLRELVPDFEESAPLETPVTGDDVYSFTAMLGNSSLRRRRCAIAGITWFRSANS